MNRRACFVAIATAMSVAWPALAADLGSLEFTYAGEKTEKFVPDQGPFYKPLERGNAHLFNVGWKREGGYAEGRGRMISVTMTAFNDGTAIQGLVFGEWRQLDFADYVTGCTVASGKACDMATVGVHHDLKARTLRFQNAKFVKKAEGKKQAAVFPESVILNGTLRY